MSSYKTDMCFVACISTYTTFHSERALSLIQIYQLYFNTIHNWDICLASVDMRICMT